MIWLLAAVAVVFVLKVCHDQRAYERAWRAEREQMEEQIDAYLLMHERP